MRATKLTLAAGAMLAVSACASGPDPATLGRLSWMIGCWQSADGASVQTWTAPRGGVMFGHATTLREGQLAAYEQARIDLRQTAAVYAVSPDGQRTALYTEAPQPPSADPKAPPQITFENDQNAFPQRVTYRVGDKGTLAATVSRLDGGQMSQFSWARCKG